MSELVAFVPRLTLDWARAQAEVGDGPPVWRTVDGTMVFADISGFTKMSERLARHGKVGAEEVTDAINTCFEQLLAVAYAAGGSLLKFGGDALLLLFSGDGHAVRAAQAAVGMRRRLRTVGRIQTSSGLVVLRISMGVHSGSFHFFTVGESHRELIVAGPDATGTVAAEGSATAGEIVMSAATAALLPARCRGPQRGDAFLLRAPSGAPTIEPIVAADAAGIDVARFVPVAIREHLLDGDDESEHRSATVAFLHFDGTDAIVEREGPAELAARLDAVVRVVQRAVEEHEVTLLGSDIDHDGGKLILVSGVPRRVGDDEQRMLTALRQIADAQPAIPLRIGAHTGSVFSGAVGPSYRRTYTVMGDTVNLAARVMSKAEPNQILTTPEVLEPSALVFATEALEPFAVKGKRRPVTAFAIGEPLRTRRAGSTRLPLVGRDDTMETLEGALARAIDGDSVYVDVVGDAGLGKTRVVEELRARAGAATCLTIRCETYEADAPYAPFWVLLRHLLDVAPNESRSAVAGRLRAAVARHAPELTTLMPLLGTPLDLDLDDTPETAGLTPEFRRQRVDEATAAFLRRVLPTPTLLVFEDVHDMDELSAGLLRRLAAEALPQLMLCATHRPDERGYLGDPGPDAVVIALEPLTEAEAVDALTRATEHAPLLPHDTRTLAHRAAGNPLFLDEMLRELDEGGRVDALPPSVDAAVTARIDRLPARHRQVLRRASVLGTSFRTTELAALLAPDGPPPDPTILRELGEFLLPEGDAMLRFRHGVMRDAVYEGLPFRQRRELHHRAAEAIASELGADAESEAAILSMHFFVAQQYDDAWGYANAAGDRAWTVYANAEAVVHFDRAIAAARRLATIEPGDLAGTWEKLGDAHERAGAYEPAQRAYRSARRLLADNPLRAARLYLKDAWIPERMGRYREAVRSVRKGLAVLEPIAGSEADERRAELAAWYAAMRADQGRFREAIEWCERALAWARASGSLPAEAHASFILDWAWVSVGRFDLATHSDRALEIYTELGDITGQAGVLQNLGGFAYYRGEWDAAVDLYERARVMRLRTGNDVDAAMGTANIAEVLVDQGHYDTAERYLDEALRVWRAANYRSGVAFARGLQARVAARTGRFAEAHELFDAARTEYLDAGLDGDAREIDGRVAECLVLEARSDEALELADNTLRAAARDDANPAELGVLQWVRGCALLQRGERDAARAAFDESLESGRSRGADYDVALALVALGRLASIEGDIDAFQARVADAAVLLDRLGIRNLPEVPVAAEPAALVD